jgi:hypothetical protein
MAAVNCSVRVANQFHAIRSSNHQYCSPAELWAVPPQIVLPAYFPRQAYRQRLDMGLDQPFLLLILNVVTTTSATSLAVICHLLKQDNLRLSAELDRRNERGASLSIPTAPENVGTEPSCDSLANAVPPEHQDIRDYVKRRSHDWNIIVDHRLENRFKANQKVAVRVLGSKPTLAMQACVLDISGNGMRLLSKVPAPCGLSVEIELDNTVARGQVCRC